MMYKSWGQYYSERIFKAGVEKYFAHKLNSCKELINLINSFLKKYQNVKILEAGMGTGILSIYFSQKGVKTYAIDLDAEVIELSKRVSKELRTNIKYSKQSIIKTNFKDYSFLISFNHGVLEHFKDSEIIKIIKEQTRIAEFFIFCVPTANANTRKSQYYGDERYLSPEHWQKIVNKSDVKIIKRINYGYKNMLWFFSKKKKFSKATFICYALKKASR